MINKDSAYYVDVESIDEKTKKRLIAGFYSLAERDVIMYAQIKWYIACISSQRFFDMKCIKRQRKIIYDLLNRIK